ncbi:MAG: poly-gamma-glutamate system protein [Calditrichaeota bacterium]|nr:poly-gamma-glutamate system protein [Calditrichota bacterium]RQW06608.1 MAG: poly-gamma-glutamate system protein [Calditrichota bacterium]
MNNTLLKDSPFRTGNVKFRRIFIIFSWSLLLLVIWFLSQKRTPVEYQQELMTAAERMQQATEEVRQLRRELEIPVNKMLDPNETGWIGKEYTPLTTTLGNLEAKLTSLNPDFAALILRWLLEMGAAPGDTVALQLSGSFPSLNIASIIACETGRFYPLISSSVCASSFGANISEFTYPDIENRLFRAGIIRHRSSRVTCGGEEDRGISLRENGMVMIEEAVCRNGYTLNMPPAKDESIIQKWKFFKEGKNIRAFINVGGNQTSLGYCPHSSSLPTGLITDFQACQHSGRGLIMLFLENQIPVIHLLDIRSLALQQEMPIAPSPLPRPGNSMVYFTTDSSNATKVILIILLVLSWLFLLPDQRRPFSFKTTSTRIS